MHSDSYFWQYVAAATICDGPAGTLPEKHMFQCLTQVAFAFAAITGTCIGIVVHSIFDEMTCLDETGGGGGGGVKIVPRGGRKGDGLFHHSVV